MTVTVPVIPSCAGNIKFTSSKTSLCTNHPDLLEIRRGNLANSGIIPIIPAYAGNTFSLGLRVSRWTIHPGVCGKYWILALATSASSHSSRRMREILIAVLTEGQYLPFIPAYAGNTEVKTIIYILITIHPGVCGKYNLRLKGALGLAHSSRRVREIHQWVIVLSSCQPFIPACAGNT